MTLKEILKKGLAIGGLVASTTMSIHANPKFINPQEVPLINSSRLMMAKIDYSEERHPVIILSYDIDSDGFEDARLIYQILPVDEFTIFTRLYSYGIDYNKNGRYDDTEIRYIDWETALPAKNTEK